MRLACFLLAISAWAGASVCAPKVLSPRQLSTRAPHPLLALDQQSPPAGANPELAPLSEMELAEQSAKLDLLTKKWERRQEDADINKTQTLGWAPNAEAINGRLSMFFLLTGLITEYYTGESIPQQVYTLLQTLSLVE